MSSASPALTGVPAGVGRTRVTSRALSSLAGAVAADALGVPASTVRIELSDAAGALSLVVAGPVRLPSLERIAADPGVVARTGGSVLERAEKAQEQIRRRVSDLSGSAVTRVVVRITGTDIRQESRVR